MRKWHLLVPRSFTAHCLSASHSVVCGIIPCPLIPCKVYTCREKKKKKKSPEWVDPREAAQWKLPKLHSPNIILALSPHFLSPLDSSISACDVVGFVCVSRVLLLDEQWGRFDSWSILVLSQSQLYLGELTVRRLRCLVHAGCHDSVLILLPRHLPYKTVRSVWSSLHPAVFNLFGVFL